MHIVLIETSGNQHYIFATNKLRENVGASELTYQIGTKYVLKAVEEKTVKSIWVEDDKDGSILRENLLNPILNPPIENADTQIEVIVATSGKAILLVRDETLAKEIVSEVTKNALKEMPGLTVHGAIGSVKDDLTDIHEAAGRVHRKLESLRYKIPNNQQRFLRLPYAEPCATSGLPAGEVFEFRNERGIDVYAFSQVTVAKRNVLGDPGKKYKKSNSTRSKGRIIDMLETIFELNLPENLEELEDVFHKTDWLAVIHADGNGLGEIFLKFEEYAKSKDGRGYIEAYRKFSLALDICTINATGFALKKLQNWLVKHKATNEVPVVPLVLGGDDLTILCSGRYALKFTRDFLAQFERETKAISEEIKIGDVAIELNYLKDVIGKIQNVIPHIANNAFGNKDENNPSIKRLGICAGVAIIKPHYPFHQAYELAEQLLKSAKQVKTKVKHKPLDEEVQLPCSAMDFHVLYDSTGVELNEIRDKLKVDKGETYLYAKPYIITPDDKLKENLEYKDEKFTNEWLNPRTWDELANHVRVMCEKEDGKRKLPNSQMHHIRESLHRGKKETDSEVNLFSHRYKDKGFYELLWKKDEPQSLFFEERHKKDGVEVDGHTTHFLDALDVVEFWKGFDCDEEKKANSLADKNSENGGGQ